ncbi:MAG: hypothetical protein VX501_08985, partial [Pseudomonadota bacterium]|nr:hypothetical protein [Pseudomonadota bacterium]
TAAQRAAATREDAEEGGVPSLLPQEVLDQLEALENTDESVDPVTGEAADPDETDEAEGP